MPPLPDKILSPHKHHFYEIFLIKEGSAIHNVDYQEYDINCATLFFISQGQLHLWDKTKRENIKGYRLMFTEDFFLLNHIDKNFLFELVFLDNIYFYPCVSLSQNTTEPIYTYFDLLYNEYQRIDTNPQVIQSLLFLTLTEIQRVSTKQNPGKILSKQLSVYKQFLELLERHLAENLSPNDYADKLCLSPKQLNRIVQSVTNQSIGNVIKNRIILEAKRLLTCTDLNVNQISLKLNFEDSAYFARFFRKETKSSPTEFKAQMAEMYRKRS